MVMDRFSKCGRWPSSWKAKIVSGSPGFIERLRDALVGLGMPRMKMYTQRDPRLYSIVWSGARCAVLYELLYGSVPEAMYLARKHERFTRAVIENGLSP